MAKITIKELSLTISQLVDIDPSQQHLIESATIRAISAKEAQAISGGWYFSKFGWFPNHE
jgi:hypothetical protein